MDNFLLTQETDRWTREHFNLKRFWRDTFCESRQVCVSDWCFQDPQALERLFFLGRARLCNSRCRSILWTNPMSVISWQELGNSRIDQFFPHWKSRCFIFYQLHQSRACKITLVVSLAAFPRYCNNSEAGSSLLDSGSALRSSFIIAYDLWHCMSPSRIES